MTPHFDARPARLRIDSVPSPCPSRLLVTHQPVYLPWQLAYPACQGK